MERGLLAFRREYQEKLDAIAHLGDRRSGQTISCGL